MREKTYSPPIKEIILENFMSYEYARIPMKEGLNLVIGPNGAGKSSILLAISVAFGQAYTERSRKLSDLIRRGKDIARVSLIFDNRERKGSRPIPYSKSDTFMLSRYLRKDGSYWYEADYREIDKSEVVRLLREFGINPDNLLIIMHQGMIEELGAISPQQRLTMVEEAVGFREYRERIFQSENDLKALSSEEGSLVQLLDNANQTVEYWKQVYDRYVEKRNLQEHRALLERELLWAQEGKLSKSLHSVREKLAHRQETLEDLEDQQKKAGTESEDLHKSLLQKQVELSKLYGAVVRAEKERSSDEGARRAMDGLRDQLESLREDLAAIRSGVDQKKMKHIQEFLDFSSQKSKRDSEEASRKKTELDREIVSLQSDLGGLEESIKKTTDEYVAQRVKFEVVGFRIKLTESEIRDLERAEREAASELEALKGDLERAGGERIITERQPYEVSEEMKLVSAQLQKLQDLPEDAEKIYKDYMGNIEGLKDKLKQLQDNRSLMLRELEERKKVWRDAVAGLIDEITPVYQRVLATVGALGAVRLEEGSGIEETGLQLLVGYKGAPPSILDPYTQSGGERSVALVAFILSLQSRIISPLRAMDEFDIHMDPKNREAIFKMILVQSRTSQTSQNIVITPSIISVIDPSAHVITVQSVHGASEVKEFAGKAR
jgi:structural maintenance of chromosomes protein 5